MSKLCSNCKFGKVELSENEGVYSWVYSCNYMNEKIRRDKQNTTKIRDIPDVIKLRIDKKYLRYLDVCTFGAGIIDGLHDDLTKFFYRIMGENFSYCNVCSHDGQCTKDNKKYDLSKCLEVNKARSHNYIKIIDILRDKLID